MRLLLDTHVLLWWLGDAPELTPEARGLIRAPDNLVFVSAATIWELRIKEAIGKIKLPKNFSEVVDNEPFEKLSITFSHTHQLKVLPLHHRDPFDRILIAQAQVEDLVLLTHDAVAKKYDVSSQIV